MFGKRNNDEPEVRILYTAGEEKEGGSWLKPLAAVLLLILVAAGGYFFYLVNRPVPYTPKTREIKVSEYARITEDIICDTGVIEIKNYEGTKPFSLDGVVSILSDVENGTRDMPAEKTVLGFYTCPAEYDIREYVHTTEYKSLDLSIVEVSEDGIVTVKGKGHTQIAVTDGDVMIKIPVTVLNPVYPDITEDITMMVGEEKAIVSREDYEFLASEMRSEKDQIVTIEQNGIIRASKKGTSLVYYTVADGTEREFKVNVQLPVSEISAKDLTVKVGDTEKVNYSLLPQGADYGTKMSFRIWDESVASVSDDGSVKGLKTGSTTLSITSENGVSKEIKVTVERKSPANMTLEMTDKNYFEGAAANKYKDTSVKDRSKLEYLRLSFDKDIKNVIFATIQGTDISNYKEAKSLFTLNSLSRGSYIYLAADIDRSKRATKAIIFTEEDGTVRRYAFTLSSDGKIKAELF